MQAVFQKYLAFMDVIQLSGSCASKMECDVAFYCMLCGMRSSISHIDALFLKGFDLKLFSAIRMDKIITLLLSQFKLFYKYLESP